MKVLLNHGIYFTKNRDAIFMSSHTENKSNWNLQNPCQLGNKRNEEYETGAEFTNVEQNTFWR